MKTLNSVSGPLGQWNECFFLLPSNHIPICQSTTQSLLPLCSVPPILLYGNSAPKMPLICTRETQRDNKKQATTRQGGCLFCLFACIPCLTDKQPCPKGQKRKVTPVTTGRTRPSPTLGSQVIKSEHGKTGQVATTRTSAYRKVMN
jgi:hypothetical protein